MSTRSFHRATRSYPERLPNDAITIVAPPPPPHLNGGASHFCNFWFLWWVVERPSYFFFSSPNKSLLLLIGIGGMVVVSAGSGLMMRVLQIRQTKQQAKCIAKNMCTILSP
jgi:hypothetical protein